MFVLLELDLVKVKDWDRKKKRKATSNFFVKLVTLEYDEFRNGFKDGFELIPLVSLLAKSY